MPELLLTPEVHDLIVRLVRGGNHLETAAAIAGVPEPTVRRWLREGRKEEREPYFTFWQEVRKAEAEKEQEWQSNIDAAARDDWQASLALLKHRFPQRWSERVKLEVQAQLDEIYAKLQARLSPEAFDQVVDAIADESTRPALRTPDEPPVAGPANRALVPGEEAAE